MVNNIKNMIDLVIAELLMDMIVFLLFNLMRECED